MTKQVGRGRGAGGPTLATRLAALRARLRELGGVVVAFSGGVDSTFLAAVAREVLGARALAVTALSPTYTPSEQAEARRLARQLGLRHAFIESNELEIPGFAENPENRCYYCKRELFEKLGAIARRHGLPAVVDGTNADDLRDDRPGRRATAELGVVSPLLEAGLAKADIRRASRRLGLPTADKPAMACLASRFPYGSRITAEKLAAVARVEAGLRALGVRQLRVRHHGDVARIEVEAGDIARLAAPALRARIVRLARTAGFAYTALDLQGYRTGSMNEVKRGRRRPGKGA